MKALLEQIANQDFENCLKTVNKFISDHEKQSQFGKEYVQLFIAILNTLQSLIHDMNVKELKGKLFSILRIITRSQDVSLNIQSNQFAMILDLMQTLQKQSSQSSTMMLVENLSIQKRLIYFNNKLMQIYNTKYVHILLDLMAAQSKELRISLLDFIKLILEMDSQLLQQEISTLYYVGKLLFLLENNDNDVKILTANLITKLLDNQQFSENFRKLTGMATVIQEIERKENDKLEIKIPFLNLLMRISSDSKNYADLKMYGVIDILLNNLDEQTSSSENENKSYMVVTTVINIFGQLSFDDDLSSKIMQKGLQKIINLVFMCHPHKVQNLKFSDINKKDYPKAILELQIYSFRLLRYLASLSRHRSIFKQLFIPRLLQQFIDIENFNKALNSYKKLVDDFNQIEPEDLLCMQETLQLSAENFYQQNSTKKLGSYEVLEQIGKGAFGSVYLCRLGSNFYAIKQINDVETMQYREAQIHSELNHPNIVKLYEYFIHEHSLCLVIEYVKGMNVQELIKLLCEKNQQMQEEFAWKILIDLLSVLRYLHFDKKIVHRDLNPANIMVDSHYSIKLCDFGLAKHFSEDIINNSFVGTLVYTCPQIVENQSYSEKADVWALGCILYEMLQQKPAFQSANPLLLAKRIVQLQYEPIKQGFYSPDLINIVELCLQKEEEKRPSVNELLEMISLRVVLLMDNIKQEKDDLQAELLDLHLKMHDQHENKRDQGEPSQQVWQMFQKLLQLTLHENKNIDAKNQYLIDQFRRKISKSESNIQTELFKLTSLSKEFIPYLPKITYEQLFFIIEGEIKQQEL